MGQMEEEEVFQSAQALFEQKSYLKLRNYIWVSSCFLPSFPPSLLTSFPARELRKKFGSTFNKGIAAKTHLTKLHKVLDYFKPNDKNI